MRSASCEGIRTKLTSAFGVKAQNTWRLVRRFECQMAILLYLQYCIGCFLPSCRQIQQKFVKVDMSRGEADFALLMFRGMIDVCRTSAQFKRISNLGSDVRHKKAKYFVRNSLLQNV